MNEKELKEKFSFYAHRFDFDDEHIVRKYLHSLRVMERAKEIARDEKFDTRMTEMAVVAGLLHDYSRFEQWATYHTFRDAQSIDHADKAVELLFDKGEIEDFYPQAENYGAIRDSIKYHNKYILPGELSGDNLVLAKLVRDADKLDIIEMLTWNKKLLVEIDEPITPAVEACFWKNRIINSQDAQNENDWILLSLAMVYDLNYAYSFRYVAEKKLLQKVFANLSHKKMFRKYFEHAKEFVAAKNGDNEKQC